MYRVLLFVFLLLPAACCVCQSDTALGEVYDYLYDFRLQDNSEIESNDFLYENHKVNINTASLQILMHIPGIDYATAKRIVDERNRNGRFFSLAELLNIEGLDKPQISSLFPYIVLNDDSRYIITRTSADSSSMPKIKADFRSGFSLRQNDLSKEYSGSDYRQYNKIRLTGESWKASLVTEKDPGEEQIDDFKSFYVQVKGRGILSSFTAGDYYIEFGQGLTIWSPVLNYMGSGPVSRGRSARGTVPAGGFNETDYLRGFSMDLKYKDISLTGFVSKARRDSEKDSAGSIVYFQRGGYHRTKTENSRKGGSTEQLYGLIARYTTDSVLSAGIMLNRTEYDLPVRQNETRELIKQVFMAAADYTLNFHRLHFKGEINSIKNDLSINNLISYQLSDKLIISIVQVSVNMNHNAFVKASVDIPSDTRAMKSVQIGLRNEVLNGVLYLYYGSRSEKRSGGIELFSREGGLSFSGTAGKSLSGYLKVRFEEEKYSEPGAILLRERNMLLNTRADLTWQTGNRLSFHWRGSYCLSYENEMQDKAEGLAFLNGIKIRLYKEIFISSCLTVYNTGSYASRLYELEKDAGGFLYSSLLYGNGIKWYIVADIPFGANAGISVKYADEAKMANKNEAVSGRISGNKRLNFQLHIIL